MTGNSRHVFTIRSMDCIVANFPSSSRYGVDFDEFPVNCKQLSRAWQPRRHSTSSNPDRWVQTTEVESGHWTCCVNSTSKDQVATHTHASAHVVTTESGCHAACANWRMHGQRPHQPLHYQWCSHSHCTAFGHAHTDNFGSPINFEYINKTIANKG